MTVFSHLAVSGTSGSTKCFGYSATPSDHGTGQVPWRQVLVWWEATSGWSSGKAASMSISISVTLMLIVVVALFSWNPQIQLEFALRYLCVSVNTTSSRELSGPNLCGCRCILLLLNNLHLVTVTVWKNSELGFCLSSYWICLLGYGRHTCLTNSLFLFEAELGYCSSSKKQGSRSFCSSLINSCLNAYPGGGEAGSLSSP